MKKIVCLVLAIALALTSALALADQLDAIKEKGYIQFATEGEWSPWTFHDESDALVGFDVEVARLIAAKMGLDAQFAEVPWDGIFSGMDVGRYDAAANGVEITEEREMKYDFSAPYGYIRTVLVVRGDNEDITCFEDLKGRSTANSVGSTYQFMAEDYGASCASVDTLDETMEMIISGRVDATLNAEVSVYDYMAAHPDANIKIVAVTEDASMVAIPVCKGDNETLLAAIDQAIAELTESGELTELSIKYFGVDISPASQK